MELYITKTGTAFNIESTGGDLYGPGVVTHPFYKAGARGWAAVLKRMDYQARDLMYKKAQKELKKFDLYHRLSPHKRGEWSELKYYVHCVDNGLDYIPYLD